MGTCLGHKANKGQEHKAGSVLRFHVCYWKPSRVYLSPEMSSDTAPTVEKQVGQQCCHQLAHRSLSHMIALLCLSKAELGGLGLISSRLGSFSEAGGSQGKRCPREGEGRTALGSLLR